MEWRNTARNVIAGTAGGVAVVLAGHPFDTLKVRLQYNTQYKSLRECFQHTVRTEGLRGLYKGATSPMAGQMFFRAWAFTSNGASKSLFSDSPRGFMLAGFLTGFLISPVESAIDLFKTKMQIQLLQQNDANAPKYRGVFDCARSLYRAHGLRGWQQGLSGTMIRNIPANGAFFGGYEALLWSLTPEGGTVSDVRAWQTLLCGSFAGLFYWGPFYPLDVVKSALMSDHPDPRKRTFSSWLAAVRTLYAEGGVRRFYRGLTPCLMRSMPANAVLFTTVQQARNLVDRSNILDAL